MSELWSSFTTKHEQQSGINDNQLFNLSSDYGILEFSGEDANHFLQGQLTNDINQVNESKSQLSGYCTPKGRLLALFRVFSLNNKYYLQCSKEILPRIQKRLQMFVMMSKVIIKDVSDEMLCIALSGKGYSDKLNQHLNSLPEFDNGFLNSKQINCINYAYSKDCYLCYSSDKNLIDLCQSFGDQIQFSPLNQWDYINIKAGIPAVVEDTMEAFIPQTINLHVLNAINFKKGCYTGQEVVARMQYLGNLKRLMYAISFDNTAVQAKPGDKVYSPESSSGQGAGKIVSIATMSEGERPKGKSVALAVLEIKIVDKKAVFLDKEHLIKAEILELPYNLETSLETSD